MIIHQIKVEEELHQKKYPFPSKCYRSLKNHRDEEGELPVRANAAKKNSLTIYSRSNVSVSHLQKLVSEQV